MATGPEFIAALSPVCSFHPSTLDRYLRELRAAEMLPLSGKGGGKSAVHFDQWHAATILVGLFATGPGGAVDAVRAVKTIRRLGAIPTPMLGGDSLWGDLAGAIGIAALKIRRHPDHKPFAEAQQSGWECVVCLDPLKAWVIWTAAGKEVRVDYSDPQLALPGAAPEANRAIRRLTSLTAEALDVCARLCVDHFENVPRFPGTENAQSETAAALPGETAVCPDQPNDKPTKMGSQQSYRNRRGEKPQSSGESRSGHSYPLPHWSDPNERERQDFAGTSSP